MSAGPEASEVKYYPSLPEHFKPAPSEASVHIPSFYSIMREAEFRMGTQYWEWEFQYFKPLLLKMAKQVNLEFSLLFFNQPNIKK